MSQTALTFINSYIKLPSQEQWRRGEKTSQPSFIIVKRRTYWRMLNIKCFEVSSFPILHHPIFNIRYQRVGEKKTVGEQSIKATTWHDLESECLGPPHWDSWEDGGLFPKTEVTGRAFKLTLFSNKYLNGT